MTSFSDLKDLKKLNKDHYVNIITGVHWETVIVDEFHQLSLKKRIDDNVCEGLRANFKLLISATPFPTEKSIDFALRWLGLNNMYEMFKTCFRRTRWCDLDEKDKEAYPNVLYKEIELKLWGLEQTVYELASKAENNRRDFADALEAGTFCPSVCMFPREKTSYRHCIQTFLKQLSKKRKGIKNKPKNVQKWEMYKLRELMIRSCEAEGQKHWVTKLQKSVVPQNVQSLECKYGTKFACVIQMLKKWKNRKVVVVVQYDLHGDILEQKLKCEKIECAMIKGQDKRKMKILERFSAHCNDEEGMNVLILTSSNPADGTDLHMVSDMIIVSPIYTGPESVVKTQALMGQLVGRITRPSKAKNKKVKRVYFLCATDTDFRICKDNIKCLKVDYDAKQLKENTALDCDAKRMEENVQPESSGKCPESHETRGTDESKRNRKRKHCGKREHCGSVPKLCRKHWKCGKHAEPGNYAFCFDCRPPN